MPLIDALNNTMDMNATASGESLHTEADPGVMTQCFWRGVKQANDDQFVDDNISTSYGDYQFVPWGGVGMPSSTAICWQYAGARGNGNQFKLDYCMLVEFDPLATTTAIWCPQKLVVDPIYADSLVNQALEKSPSNSNAIS